MTPLPRLLDLAERVAAAAGPGEQVEAFVARGRSTTVRAHGGEVESLTSAESSGIGIRVVADGRQGFASAGTLDEGVVHDTLADARDNAAFAAPDPFVGLAEPDGVEPPPLDLWRPELAAFPEPAKVDLALDLERAVVAADRRVRGVRSSIYGDSAGEVAVAASTGVQGSTRGTSCYLAVTALAGDGDETQVGYGVDAARRPDDLDVATAAAMGAERATRLLGARQAPSQRVTLVLEPRLAASVLGIVGGMLTGERVLKGRSPFADRVGEEIASPLLTLVDDPTDPRSFGADAHDGEGLATRANRLLDGGVLCGFLHNAYTGRRARAASTGSAVRGFRSAPGVGCQALAMAPARGAGTIDDVLAAVGDGFLVQSMSGLHSGVNPVSGDFSVGAEGLMVRDGQLAEPVREITIASTLQRMLKDVVAVGADLEWLPGGTGAVTVAVADVALGGA